MPSFAAKPTRRMLRAQRGTTLIEVLVAVAVTSVGLLGIAGLMAVAAKLNEDAFFHTQASYAAQALIESMHVNLSAVAAGNYDGIYSGSAAFVDVCRKQGCTPKQRAESDRLRFDRALVANLPNVKASMNCIQDVAAQASPASYSGICRLRVGWSVLPGVRAPSIGPRSQVWVFQP